MFDTMTLTKVVGGVCGALLIYLFANWAAEVLYYGGGEGQPQAYTVATTEAAPAAATGDAAAASNDPAYADVSAAADVAAGEKLFGKCKACHKIDGTNATGPHLNGVVGRARGGVEGFGYSEAMKADSAPWTPENLYAFLKSPKTYMPNTKMGFAGLPKPEDRANIIAYLATLQ